MAKEEPMKIDTQIKPVLNSEDSFWWLKFIPQPNIWTNVNIHRFLRLYKTYSVLWDPENHNYSKSSERSRGYEEISKKLNFQDVNEKECMKLVESMKTIFFEEKQRRESSVRKYQPPPAWFQVLNDIVESVMNNAKEKSSGIDINQNEINNEKMKELIKCVKIYTENNWTPNYLKTDVEKLFLPEKKSFVTRGKNENIKKDSETVSNKNIDTFKRSWEYLKPKKCANFENISCDLKNDYCGCSVETIQNVKKYYLVYKKYCPEFKNILCDCLSQSGEKEKNLCPELQNIICCCSLHSIENVGKYCPEYKDFLCDCSSKKSSSSKNTELSEFSISTQEATSITFRMPTLKKKKVDHPYEVELDRYCYYKNWSKYYKCKILDSKRHYEKPCQPEKKFDEVSNQKPLQHKIHPVFEPQINVFY